MPQQPNNQAAPSPAAADPQTAAADVGDANDAAADQPLKASARLHLPRSHVLASAAAKYNRAVEDYDTFRAEAIALMNRTAKTARFTQRRLDDRTIQFFAVVEEIPLSISCHLGDIVHGLRTALDHLAWALAKRHNYAGKPRYVHFPIARDPGDFATRRSGFEAMFGPAAVGLIAHLQPYQNLEGLRWVTDLDNVDKHEALVTVRHHLDVLELEVSDRATGAPFQSFPPEGLGKLQLKDDGLLFTLKTDKPLPGKAIKLRVKLGNTFSPQLSAGRSWNDNKLELTLIKVFADVKFCLESATTFIDSADCFEDEDCRAASLNTDDSPTSDDSSESE
jgi:hypothetical protein